MIRIGVRGGMIAVADLRKLVEWCLTNGVRQIMPGMRQDILLLDATARQTESLRTIGFEPIPEGSFNVMSALPATGIQPSIPWVTNAVYRRILETMRIYSSLRIQIHDPAQTLLTGLSSDLLFAASRDVDVWNIYVYDEATRQLRIVNTTCSTVQVPTIAAALEKSRMPFAEVFPYLQEGFGLKRVPSTHPFRPLTAPLIEGMHVYPDGHWLGVTARDGIFSPDTIQRVIGVARQAGTGYLFVTPYHSLLLKNLPEASLGLASTLPLRHAEQELFWQSTAEAIGLRQKVSQALLQRQLPLKVPAAALTIGDHVEAPLRLIRVRRMPLRINLEIAEQSESGYEFKVRQSGSLRSMLPAIAFAEGTWRRPGPRSIVTVENNLICPDCETAYISEYGDPAVGILPGTLLDDLPEDYCCSVCGYLFRAATQRLVTGQVA